MSWDYGSDGIAVASIRNGRGYIHSNRDDDSSNARDYAGVKIATEYNFVLMEIPHD